MHHAAGNAAFRHEFAFGACRPAVRRILHDFKLMTVRIGDNKIVISSAAFVYLLRDLHPTSCHIVAHTCGIVGVDGYMIQAILASGWLRKEFYILFLIDLYKGDTIGAVLAFQSKRLLESKKVFVECARLIKIAVVKSYMGDTQYSRPLYVTLLCK